MGQSTEQLSRFYLSQAAFRRASWLAALQMGVFVLCIVLGLSTSWMLWPTYTHVWTFYLKWQDAILLSGCCLAFLALVGCGLCIRFYMAQRAGVEQGIVTLQDGNVLIVRDLSPKNYLSIYSLVFTAFACFIVMLIGLSPWVLLGWTVHLTNPVFAVFATLIALLLALGGLAISLPFGSFIIIGLVGSLSYGQRMGAAEKYILQDQTIVRIDGYVLAIIQPDRPEALVYLDLMTTEGRRSLLMILQERWVEADKPWNVALDKEIERALNEETPTASGR